MSKYGVISGPYFPVFGLNREIYGVNLEHLWVTSRVISPNGDIEINPGLESKNALNRCFSIFFKNLNSISAHMFTKVFLLSAYISVHKFYIICLTEIYLNLKSHLMTKFGNIWRQSCQRRSPL